MQFDVPHAVGIDFHYDPQLDVAPQPAAPSAAEEPALAAPADGARAHSDDGNGGEEGGKSRHHAPLRPDKVAEAVKAAFAETRISPSAKMNPDPSLRGLRYGKPPKTTDAYTYVDEPPRRRADRFLWIAIIAAAIAVAAIAFGYYREAQERRAEEQYLLELTGGASGDEASGDVSAEGDDATNESNH